MTVAGGGSDRVGLVPRPAEVVWDVLARYCGIDAGGFTPDAVLMEDIGLQSLDLAETVALLEEHADVPVEVDDLATLVRVEDLVALVDRSLRAAGRAVGS